MTQVNLGILLRPWETEQSKLMKGAHRFESCWLLVARYVCPGDQKVVGRQGKKSQAGQIKKIEGKAVWERIWHALGICVCFSLEIG